MPQQLLVFELDERNFAINVDSVIRAIRAVEVTPLPQAPQAVLGVINVQGQVVPVYDLRQRFGLPVRPVSINDQMIIANAGNRSVAIVVNEVHGIVEYDQSQIVQAEQIVPGVEWIEGLLKMNEKLVVIHDLETFLSSGEQEVLDIALKRMWDVGK
ncbi:MAG TPA: chemotaxis protein CheW [Blastocatellia bacterium]|nr:chemotaxis protein CheW [Blastocatellia bacterium]